MGLFKHLYFDFGFLNPFKGRNKEKKEQEPTKIAQVAQEIKQEKRSLPPVSKRLIQGEGERKPPKLPKVTKKVEAPPKIEAKSPAKHTSSTDNSSFFQGLFTHIDKEDAYMHSNLPEKVLEKNLLTEMHSYWKDKKEELNDAVMSSALKEELKDKVRALHDLEIEWQRLQLQHERIRDELASKELLIENHIRDLKRGFKKMHVLTNIPEHHQFVLSNGEKLRNLHELMDALRIMDNGVFKNHVNEQKNDFSSWIHDVMGLEELAQSLSQGKSRHHMATIIENWMHSHH